MKYVSDERLKELSVNNPEFDLHIETLHKLVNRECKELPDQQWQTIDEFKANPVDGWCWIHHKSLKTTMSHYKRVFTVNGEMFADEYITHVMPIKTPEAPK